MPNSSKHAQEVLSGNRFEFGENWRRFLETLTEDRIQRAEESLLAKLNMQCMKGSTFLDVGSGSGLFSLAARRLGAKVHSLDYDPESVACTRSLKSRFFENDESWRVEEGSVLDSDYMSRLGQFDIVYSWGVLHHTGDMWTALNTVDGNVHQGGRLFIALYNDQGGASKRWTSIKKIYNRLPKLLRNPFAMLVYAPLELRSLAIHTVRGKPADYFRYIRDYGNQSGRGMTWWRDKIDWIGGYPFEVSKPEQIFSFYRTRGYALESLTTCGGSLGCNEYVFRKDGVR